jgi:sterol desaturase/sphingolipid hydroxylase (fatty acid hydroxylase superfamily)
MWFLIISLLFIVLERLFPWRRGQGLARRGVGTDLLHWVFNGYLFYYLGYGIVAGYAFSLFTRFASATGFGEALNTRLVSGWPLWEQFILLFLLRDFLMWCTHNLLHRVPFLWEIHKVHHSVETMDWIGNMRYHWGEIVVYNLTMFLPVLILGADAGLFIYTGIIDTLLGHFNHSNLRVDTGPLRYIFNSPRMHLWHHDKDGPGSHNKNFAIGLSLWDWIFGTAYYPADDEPEQPRALGFEGIEEYPRTFVDQQLFPLSRLWRRTLLFPLLAIGVGTVIACSAQTGKTVMTIDKANRSVSFTGTIFPSQFNSWRTWPKNHHFIVWKGGRSSSNALIEADANDLDLQRALESLGAVAGNNLTLDSWDRRKDPSNPDPDLHVKGTLIDVTIAWAGHAPVHASDIFVDKGGHGFEFRFGGHEKFIPNWKSGCIVCLESCPGGRVSNARYSLRDYQNDVALFNVRRSLLPKDGTAVTITLRSQ